MGIRSFVVSLFLLFLTGCAGVQWPWSYRDISERPDPENGVAEVGPSRSTINVHTGILYSAIAEALNRQGVSGRVQGRRYGVYCQDIVVVKKLGNFCLDADYDFGFEQTGPFVVTGSKEGLLVTVPVRISGGAGFSGTLAQWVSLDHKAVRGVMDIKFQLKPDITTDWCPVVDAAASFAWREPAELEVVGGRWVDISSSVNEKIQPALDDFAHSLSRLLDCAEFKRSVETQWRPYRVVAKTPWDRSLHIALVPQAAYFSGPLYEMDRLLFSVGLDAMTQVSTDLPAVPAPPYILPALQRSAPDMDRLSINLPVRISYQEIRNLLNSTAKGRRFEANGPNGVSVVQIEDTDVYAKGDRIVVGVKFRADTGYRRFDARGWVYVVAKPVVDRRTKEIRVEDVSFSRIIDNDLWNVLSGIFQDRIRGEIIKAGVLPLERTIADLREDINRQFADPKNTGDLDVSIAADDIGLGRVVATTDGLVSEITLQGRAAVKVRHTSVAVAH